MKIKRITILLLSIVGLFFLIGCQDNGQTINPDGSVTETYSFFLGVGEDPQYYDNYTGNPVYQYLSEQTWHTNDDGVDVKVAMEFQSPPTGEGQNVTNTMIATGSYTDIMDMSFYNGSIVDLYEQGIVMDITEYVETYMPNYIAFLDEHPEYKRFATQTVDGEQRYMQLYNYHDYSEPFWGFNYRRDWIVKYADEVHDITPFSHWEDENGNWVDDVEFPSGGTDPYYISDWEWMMEIFDYALDSEGITDGYVFSLPYSGYYGTGDLMPTGGGFFIQDDTIKYGPKDLGFRAYLQMVSTWYENDWIDTHFMERTNQMFYQTGTENFMTGRVGLWYGGTYAHDDALDTGEPNSNENGYTDGIFVMSAPQPINDMYGDESVQNLTPFNFYLPPLQYNPIAITTAAEDKDLIPLFKMFNYLFSEEGSILVQFGLNAEQYALLDGGNALMEREGFTEGLYDWIDVDGVQMIQFKDPLYENLYLRNAMIFNRGFGLQATTYMYLPYSPTKQRSMDLITHYNETGTLLNSFIGQLGVEESKTYSKTNTNLMSFLDRSIPNFVTGVKDPYSDSDWNALMSAINKYNVDDVTETLQDLYDSFN